MTINSSAPTATLEKHAMAESAHTKRDHPIIFSSPMVRALLQNRKTMTRRIAWRSETDRKYMSFVCDGEKPPSLSRSAKGLVALGGVYWLRPSPWQKVKPGDRLWVRETWNGYTERVLGSREGCRIMAYRVSDEDDYYKGMKWRSPIHMRRSDSRLTLVVTATKIERLQDISNQDAISEGCECVSVLDNQDASGYRMAEGTALTGSPISAFEEYWTALHGPGSWDANPEVVALTFTVRKTNINQIGRETGN